MKNGRKIFIETLTELAQKDDKVILVVGDVGFSFIEEYQQKYPDQFINCGCIEQSMIGIAAGLARVGKKPYVYSGTPFVLFRPAEQVRNDITYQKLNVKLIGVSHSGFLGFTHNLLHPREDINFCKNIKLKHYTPSKKTLSGIIKKTYAKKETCYIRL